MNSVAICGRFSSENSYSDYTRYEELGKLQQNRENRSPSWISGKKFRPHVRKRLLLFQDLNMDTSKIIWRKTIQENVTKKCNFCDFLSLALYQRPPFWIFAFRFFWNSSYMLRQYQLPYLFYIMIKTCYNKVQDIIFLINWDESWTLLLSV